MNNRRGVRVQTRFVAVLTLACFGPVAVGCVSHEYVIPKQELQRLVDVPPHQRGERVYLVQDVGSRRANAVEANPEAWERDTYAQVYVDGYIQIPAGSSGPSGHYGGAAVPRVAPRGAGVAQPAGWRAPRRRRQLDDAAGRRRRQRRAVDWWRLARSVGRRGGGGAPSAAAAGGLRRAAVAVAVVVAAARARR